EVELGNLKEADTGRDFHWRPSDEVTILIRGGIDKEVTYSFDITPGALPQGCGKLSFSASASSDTSMDNDPSQGQGNVNQKDYQGNFWMPLFPSLYQQPLRSLDYGLFFYCQAMRQNSLSDGLWWRGPFSGQALGMGSFPAQVFQGYDSQAGNTLGDQQAQT
ncbi:MAG: hypothetical protein ABIG43_03645, partial [Chloroflexota bacterium]